MIGDDKGNISSFNINDNDLKVIKKVHNKTIYAMVKFNRKLVSGGFDKMIKFTTIEI